VVSVFFGVKSAFRMFGMYNLRAGWLVLAFALLTVLLLGACGGGEAGPTPSLEKSVLPSPSRASVLFSPLSPLSTPTISAPTQTATQVIADEGTARQLRVFTQLWETVRDTYVYPDYNGLDWDEVQRRYRVLIEAGMADDAFYEIMREMIDALGDDHSGFYSPEEVAEEEERLSGQLDYEGIGIYVTMPADREHAVLLQVFPDSPAERAGLQPHDRILSIDGMPVLDEAGEVHLDLLEGPVGGEVRLLVQTPGHEPRELTVTRERVHAQLLVEARRMAGTDIGYILIPTFWDQTLADRVRQALESLMAEGDLEGLILDMRINGGGLLAQLQGTLALFTVGDAGVFVSRTAERPLIVTADAVGRSQELPLVILVGRETESFGEVFSGVLQESGRAHVVGRTTPGNVETLLPVGLEDGSRAWIASETFRPPSGADWEESGIRPDVEIPLDWDEFTVDTDRQLHAALELLLQALAE
jgi:C-terminal peptidase prc